MQRLVSLTCLVLITMFFYSSILHSNSSNTSVVQLEQVWTQQYYVINEPGYILVRLKTTRSSDPKLQVSLIKDQPLDIEIKVLREREIAEMRGHEETDLMIVYKVLEINITTTRPSQERLCFNAFLNITVRAIKQEIASDQTTLMVTVCEIDPLIYLQKISKEIERSNTTLSNLISAVDGIEDEITLIRRNLSRLIDIYLSDSNTTSRAINELGKTINSGYVDMVSYLKIVLSVNIVILVAIVSTLIFRLLRYRKRRDSEDIELMGL